jgi:hypothetical protein
MRRLAGVSPQPSLCTHGRFLPGTRMANWRHKTCIQKRIALGCFHCTQGLLLSVL